ncbi:MAG: Crp/Fnr family transcriptional regulator [Candidatus Dormibacteraceae bacterium]
MSPTADKLAFMQRLNLFEGMSHEEVESISKGLVMREHERGSLIGDGHERVYLIKQGRVRLCNLTEDGHEVTTAVLVPGQIFGLGSLFGREQQAVLAQCVEDCYVCEAGAQDFLAILSRHPLMMARVMMAMAKQIFRLQETVEQLALEPARSRLARHLLSLADAGTLTEGGCLLPPVTQEEMAKVIAARRETVARALGAWRQEGILLMRGRRIVLCDLERLRGEVSYGPAT